MLAGLYGFDLANLQLQQLHVDEAFRNSVGAVESSLCSLGTMAAYLAALVVSAAPKHTGVTFDALVYGSMCFVGLAAIVYTLWVLFFHEHEHNHPLFEDQAKAPHVHRHTSQQRRTLELSQTRTHVHLHFHMPWEHSHDDGRTHTHDHDHETHGSSHGHSHGH